MARWGRRLLYGALAIIWLLLMLLPLTAAVLAIQGEIEIGGDGRHHVRVFLLQQRNAEGIGVTWARPLRAQPNCRRTSVRYLMWRGQGENVTYCDCIDPATGANIGTASCP